MDEPCRHSLPPCFMNQVLYFHSKGFLVYYFVPGVIMPLPVPSHSAYHMATTVTWATSLNCAAV